MAAPSLFLSIMHFLHFVMYYMAFWCNYTFSCDWVEFMCGLIENLFHNSLIIYYYLTLQYMQKNYPLTVISILSSVKSITFPHLLYYLICEWWNFLVPFSRVTENFQTLVCGKYASCPLQTWVNCWLLFANTAKPFAMNELPLFVSGTGGWCSKQSFWCC